MSAAPPGGRYRLLLDAKLDGPRNMAVDDVLLEVVAAGQSLPVVRLYGFSPPTISLGRFQPAASIDIAGALQASLQVVRRPSGGQAVLHDDELTYAMVLGRGHPSFGKRTAYRFVSGLLLDCLAELGVQLGMNETGSGDPRNPDCMAGAGQYEIADAVGRKLVGSAQAAIRGGILQHGAIPITDSNRRLRDFLVTPPPAGAPPTNMSQATGKPTDFLQLRQALAEVLAQHLDVVQSRLSESELLLVEKRVQGRYARWEWTHRL